MSLLADEGVDKQIVVRLREEGYSVSYVAEMAPGISDDVVLELANNVGGAQEEPKAAELSRCVLEIG
jgi:hypothetical protein